MCGIVGYSNKETTKADLVKLHQVMVESRIRGKHASGIAWYDSAKINCVSKPLPIDELLDDFDMTQTLYGGTKVALIAHSRYSTSSIQFNQPIASSSLAIAHNGVITQSSPDTWAAKYGYKCNGANDSELLLRAIENNDDPFIKFPRASIAAVVLNNMGEVYCMRNSLRPLWKGKIGKGVVFASTYSILSRSGVLEIEKVKCVGKDMQRRDCTKWTP